MLKKIVVGILALSVIGAAGAAIGYQAVSSEGKSASAASLPVLAGEEIEAGQADELEAVPQGSQGEPWQATGTIAEVDDYGLYLELENGEDVYVELGPPDYWQAQEIDLQMGMQASVVGTIMDGVIHAAEVQLADGKVLELRNEQGKPLWSGGLSKGEGQNAQQGQGEQNGEPQAQVDEWITVSGTLMAYQGGSMTLSTLDGDLLTFQTGQSRFFANQGVTFQVGDEIEVVGFYQGSQFMAGEIKQVSTGLRVMLRDPNGRPLWAGPGNGNGNGNGNGKGKGNGNGNGNGRRNSGGQL